MQQPSFKDMPRGAKKGLGPGFVSILIALGIFLLVWQVFDGYTPVRVHAEDTTMFELSSNAFAEGERIPVQYTCEGEDISPELTWTNPPEGTQAYALICEDPDAPVGLWVHWVLYNVPGDRTSLPEALPDDETVLGGAMNGTNSWPDGRIGYSGPCPPPGDPHRYYFYLYALSEPVELQPRASKEDLVNAMAGKILGTAEWMGTYSR